MPKKTPPPPAPAPKPPRRRSPTEPPLPGLDLKEREKLRVMLADPAFERALALIQIGRPSVYINGTGGHVTDATASVQSANNRLHEMRGWDLYQTALFALVREEKPRTPQPTETYPDSGSLDHEN